ncbi:butyrophilin subfamily 3 member A2-like [Cheilinus undulatus]|uniref:butyrophilin subfamily 3 member A2-like n=1 Tax=Cheilinus undulatus TaxID=241271 RepID=UPI001BD4DF31|nr:butyrophilin subfamily 3 member A2-like [Cheilinus undulatus]
MFYHVLLGAALLICSTGESLVHGLPQTVQVLAGGDVILPCRFSTSTNEDFPTVEWSKEGLYPNVVFLYRDGSETYAMKNPAFEYRTSLVMKELKNGNVSLRISSVQLSDSGTYRCMRLWRSAPREITTVKLFVGAASEPKLSFLSAESGGVTLQCEADCWLPEPGVTFLDHQGREISADEPRGAQDARGCYTVTRRVILHEATERVTCRVHQPQINQTRTAETLIPGGSVGSCSSAIGMAVGGTLFLLSAVCGLAFLLWKKYQSAGAHKLTLSRRSSSSTKSIIPEDQPFLQGVRVHGGVSTVEKLSQQMEDLQSKLQETIHRLEIYCNSQLVTSSGGPPRNSNPGQTARRHRIHSNPNVLTFAESVPSSVSSSKKRVSFDGPSLSTSPPPHGPKAPNIKRRHSSVLPHSISNGFKLHPDLQEEHHAEGW